jgi:transposase
MDSAAFPKDSGTSGADASWTLFSKKRQGNKSSQDTNDKEPPHKFTTKTERRQQTLITALEKKVDLLTESLKDQKQKTRSEKAKSNKSKRKQASTERRNRKLKHHIAELKKRIAELEQQLEESGHREADICAQRKEEQGQLREEKHNRYGRKSERDDGDDQQDIKKRPRGQQSGSVGHGRKLVTEVPFIDEQLHPNPDQLICPTCNKPLKLFSTDHSQVVECATIVYTREIHRHGYRSQCQCNQSAHTVLPPIPSKLILRGKYGTSLWATSLVDKFVYSNPSYRLLQRFNQAGLKMSAGSLTDGYKKILPMVEPYYEALRQELLLAKQWNIDETHWDVVAEYKDKEGNRWWLWVFRSKFVTIFELFPFRSAELLNIVLGTAEPGIILCDRYSAYGKFGREHPGFVLSWCWVHVRRDWKKLGRSYPDLAAYAKQWTKRIGKLFHLHNSRLAKLNAPDGNAEYQSLHEQLVSAMDDVIKQLKHELSDPNTPPEVLKPLQSMENHLDGLLVPIKNATVEMHNNAAERALRLAVVGRKNYYGSRSEWSGRLAARAYSIFATASQWSLNPLTLMTHYLDACAANGGNAPTDLTPFLPKLMDAKQLAIMRAPYISDALYKLRPASERDIKSKVNSTPAATDPSPADNTVQHFNGTQAETSSASSSNPLFTDNPHHVSSIQSLSESELVSNAPPADSVLQASGAEARISIAPTVDLLSTGDDLLPTDNALQIDEICSKARFEFTGSEPSEISLVPTTKTALIDNISQLNHTRPQANSTVTSCLSSAHYVPQTNDAQVENDLSSISGVRDAPATDTAAVNKTSSVNSEVSKGDFIAKVPPARNLRSAKRRTLPQSRAPPKGSVSVG